MKHFYFCILLLFHIKSFNSFSQNNFKQVTDSNKINYQTFGTGTPILIINGGPGMNSKGFQPVAETISRFGFKTIIYDQRGTGKSHIEDISQRTMKIDLMVEDIEVLRKDLDIDKWIVMGHSFGGMLAYNYAVKFPERTLGLIQSSSGGMDLSLLELIDLSVFLSPTEKDSLSYYNYKLQRGDTTYATRLKRGLFLAPAYVYDRKHIPLIAHRLTQGNSLVNGLIWQNLRDIDFDLKEELKTFDKPALIIQGKEDFLGISLAIKAHEILPKSELVIMLKTRHYGWLDSPQHFYNSIEKFLSKNFLH